MGARVEGLANLQNKTKTLSDVAGSRRTSIVYKVRFLVVVELVLFKVRLLVVVELVLFKVRFLVFPGSCGTKIV